MKNADPRIHVHVQYIFGHGSNRLAAATSLSFFRENDQLRWEISSYTRARTSDNVRLKSQAACDGWGRRPKSND